MFQEVGGFREGRGKFSSGLSQPGGEGELLSSLAERALILRYRLPDSRSWKRLWEGWVKSFMIIFALLLHHVRKISRMEVERRKDDFCSCVHCLLEGLAACCTTVPVPDSDAAGQHALNGSPVESGEGGWREGLALFSRRRKFRCCCGYECCLQMGQDGAEDDSRVASSGKTLQFFVCFICFFVVLRVRCC